MLLQFCVFETFSNVLYMPLTKVSKQVPCFISPVRLAVY